MSSRIEPYDAREVAKLLVSLGAEPQPGKGGHRLYVMPNGAAVKCNNQGPVPTPAAKHIASTIGRTFAEFRSELGHPLVNGGKPKKAVERHQQTYSKRDVLNRINDLRRQLVTVEQAVKPGVRDSAFYRRVYERLMDANREVESAVSTATSTGAVNV